MARSRNIKPSLFKNELLGVADPMLTILFASLWCLSDRDGRMEDRPLRIKAETFPYRENIDINGYLTELERLGFIHRYSVGDLKIIQVVNFDKHQNPHKTERHSCLPEYQLKSDSCEITVKGTLSDVEITEAAVLIPDSFNLIPDINTTPAKADVYISTSTSITKNKPRKEKIEYGLEDILKLGVDEQKAKDWISVRKKKRLLLTQSALEHMAMEASKVGLTLKDAIEYCSLKSWAGFESRYIDKGDQRFISFYELATGKKPQWEFETPCP